MNPQRSINPQRNAKTLTNIKRPLNAAFTYVQDKAVGALMPSVGTHKLLLAPGFESLRWQLGRMRAWRTFERAAKRVPAYREFLAGQGFPTRLDTTGGIAQALATIPEMDKDSYIRAFPLADRCVDGRIPRKGVIADESSGSSGTPTSWVRGKRERMATRQILQLGYANTARDMPHQPFILNAFSLGAWATGMNVTTSLTDVAMIKSIGPDPTKIIATMHEFGPDYTYVIMSYPPFLKALFDDDRLDWDRYDIVAAFGGEGISEGMRERLLHTAAAVYGSYGASDLEINLGLENDYTVALRQLIAAEPRLARRITRMADYGVLPMIFQFNPFNYQIETNAHGELLVTIARAENLSPRIRYNIHDRGHVLRIRDLLPVLDELGLSARLPRPQLDLPLLFHYGRSDMSVDFNGAVVGPDSVRDAITADPALLECVENHRLISFEDAHGDKQLHIALQLVAGVPRDSVDQDGAAAGLFARLRAANGDFDNAITTSDTAMLPTLACYDYRTGPFAHDDGKLKNQYVAHLDADAAAGQGLDLRRRAGR